MSDEERASKHQHGTLARHTAGCRCLLCRAAKAAWQRHRRRQQAYGRWQPYMDAEPVRAHVRELMAAGLGCHRIAELAGVNPRLIGHLLYGSPHRNAPPTRRIRPRYAAALLAVRADPSALADGALTDGTGTRRRLRALGAIGWPAAHLADQLGMNPTGLRVLIRADGRPVKAATARKVTALYDQLWDTPGPSSAARARAAKAGWLVPLAWDDETLDDPAAHPAAAARRYGARRSHELWQDSEELRAQGLPLDQIADRLGVALCTLKRARERAQADEHGARQTVAATSAVPQDAP